MDFNDYGALLIGLFLIALFGGYLYGYRHGRRDQFEVGSRNQEIAKSERIIL